MAEKTASVFETLNNIDVSGKVEKKGNLNYVSWATAWGELKKAYPDANYTIYERDAVWPGLLFHRWQDLLGKNRCDCKRDRAYRNAVCDELQE